mgnify:CR=1 FL=1
MVHTVIGINSGTSWPSPKKKGKTSVDKRKELQEIIAQVEAAKNRLADLTLDMEADGRETGGLDAVLENLDDSIDGMWDVLDDEEWE